MLVDYDEAGTIAINGLAHRSTNARFCILDTIRIKSGVHYRELVNKRDPPPHKTVFARCLAFRGCFQRCAVVLVCGRFH